jgi:hypothetical protein
VPPVVGTPREHAEPRALSPTASVQRRCDSMIVARGCVRRAGETQVESGEGAEGSPWRRAKSATDLGTTDDVTHGVGYVPKPGAGKEPLPRSRPPGMHPRGTTTPSTILSPASQSPAPARRTRLAARCSCR